MMMNLKAGRVHPYARTSTTSSTSRSNQAQAQQQQQHSTDIDMAMLDDDDDFCLDSLERTEKQFYSQQPPAAAVVSGLTSGSPQSSQHQQQQSTEDLPDSMDDSMDDYFASADYLRVMNEADELSRARVAAISSAVAVCQQLNASANDPSRALYPSCVECGALIIDLNDDLYDFCASCAPKCRECDDILGEDRRHSDMELCEECESLFCENCDARLLDPNVSSLCTNCGRCCVYCLEPLSRARIDDFCELCENLERESEDDDDDGYVEREPVSSVNDVPAASDQPLQNGNSNCIVCFDNPVNSACVPCGHCCVCATCYSGLVQPKKCPVCRKKIEGFLRLFFS